MDISSLIGDYKTFFSDTLTQLRDRDISIAGYPMSHLGVRTETIDEYEKLREQIKKLCISYVENEHNGRPISKLLLREPLILPEDFSVSLIELMPPKLDVPYPSGLEHCGVVIGEHLEQFAEEHKSSISGRQDQGPYCQPFFINLENGKRIKFYDVSLKDVVEKEGHMFRTI